MTARTSSSSASHDNFPILTQKDVLAFQFSFWYPAFASFSIKSTVIRPLDPSFHEYLDADGVFLPLGSDGVPTHDDDDNEEDEDESRKYAFPELDQQIRDAVKAYGSVFPKLNFSSPKDASWLLPSSSPLKCLSPADVYILLKSSDFITHDLSTDSVFDGCEPDETVAYELELVLRKWYAIDCSRELRCFVRDGSLIGMSQRDENYYEFLNDPATQARITSSVRAYWESHIHPKWRSPASYTFDILLTRDLSKFHILDFNPYAPRTDALLFTYPELHSLPVDARPVLRVIDSPSHPAATRNAPVYQHNMVPIEALSLSSGRGVADFQAAWEEEVKKGMQDDDE